MIILFYIDLVLFYPVCGAKVPSSVTLRPAAILSWIVMSVANVLSVFHFSVNVRP